MSKGSTTSGNQLNLEIHGTSQENIQGTLQDSSIETVSYEEDIKTDADVNIDTLRPLHRSDINLLNVDHPIDSFNKLTKNKIPLELQIIPSGKDKITDKHVLRGKWKFAYIMRYDGRIREVSAKELGKAIRSLPKGIWYPIYLEWGFFVGDSNNKRRDRAITNAVRHVPLQMQKRLRDYLEGTHQIKEGVLKPFDRAGYKQEVDVPVETKPWNVINADQGRSGDDGFTQSTT